MDLVLLHQPFGDTFGAWCDLVSLYKEGKVRAIGVSNFYADRLVEKFCEFNDVVPMVNQMERHPLNQNTELMEWERQYGVTRRPGRLWGGSRGRLFENEVLGRIMRMEKPQLKIMLRWNVQRGVTVIPSRFIAIAWPRTSTCSTSGSLPRRWRPSRRSMQVLGFFSHAGPKMVSGSRIW